MKLRLVKSFSSFALPHAVTFIDRPYFVLVPPLLFVAIIIFWLVMIRRIGMPRIRSHWHRMGVRFVLGKWPRALFLVGALMVCLWSAASFEWAWVIRHESSAGGSFLDVLGVCVAFGICYLYFGMWFYWVEFDDGSKTAKTLWFVVLLIGMWYGSLLYFLCVYLPGYRRMKDRELQPWQHGRSTEWRGIKGSKPRNLKRAGLLLLGGWVAMFTYVTLLFTFPHAMTPIADWFGGYFTLVPAFLFLASLVFVLALLLSIGMRKSK